MSRSPRRRCGGSRRRSSAYDEPFRLAGLSLATTLTGSALIALALAEGAIDADAAWAAAHVDEDWNISQWGEDAEAAARRARRRADFRAAALALSPPPPCGRGARGEQLELAGDAPTSTPAWPDPSRDACP